MQWVVLWCTVLPASRLRHSAQRGAVTSDGADGSACRAEYYALPMVLSRKGLGAQLRGQRSGIQGVGRRAGVEYLAEVHRG